MSVVVIYANKSHFASTLLSMIRASPIYEVDQWRKILEVHLYLQFNFTWEKAVVDMH